MFPGDLGRRKAFEQERLKELLEAVLGSSLQLTGPSVSTIRCVKLGFNRQIHDDSLHYAAELFSHREFCHDHLPPPPCVGLCLVLYRLWIVTGMCGPTKSWNSLDHCIHFPSSSTPWRWRSTSEAPMYHCIISVEIAEVRKLGVLQLTKSCPLNHSNEIVYFL